ncbi:MAG: histidine--tRNA ligase [Planctomycetes bacterium]|nr:histidine--tRNA ligase [Planctomycetota bacterium]
MKLQAPKGTRDFYPQDMAWRQYLIDAWRRVSERHGFEQVDGPVFESLDLYKVKSGEGIVSELFHFEDRGGRELAIRPEFTPTLARMVADRANSLPKPIKWFATPNFCRAERPQRGRLREFWQWNIDMLGLETPAADAEVILVAVDLLRELGLTHEQVKVKLSHREVVRTILLKLGVPDEKMLEAFALLDARDKLPPEEFIKSAAALGLDEIKVERFTQMCRRKYPAGDVDHLRRSVGIDDKLDDFAELDQQLATFGLTDWCEYDLGIVRGLAYYTGTVFELHETTGALRALAGGGRYDRLIEMFGGPATPAVGFGMGDVVLSLVLQDKKLVPDRYTPVPDAFVVAASDTGAAEMYRLVADLRRQGLHTRFSYKATRNVGKLLKDAAGCGARFAVILGDEVSERRAAIKDMSGGEQQDIALDQIAAHING